MLSLKFNKLNNHYLSYAIDFLKKILFFRNKVTQVAKTNGNVSFVIPILSISRLITRASISDINTHIPSLTFGPAKTVAHKTALKP